MGSQTDIISHFGLTLDWATLPFEFAKIPGAYGDIRNPTTEAVRYKLVLKSFMSPAFIGAMLRESINQIY